MSTVYDYTASLERSRVSRAGTSRPRRFQLADREWILLPGVFSPTDTRSTAAHMSLLTFVAGTSFLEIGCGTGVIAVSAALAGCRRVVATDINPAAVANAAANAALWRVDQIVEPSLGDMCDGLGPSDRFDTIYWHSNNAWAPAGLKVNLHELAYVDPGYRSHTRFFQQALAHLNTAGRLLIGVSSRADRQALDALAELNDIPLASVASTVVDELEGPITYELLEARATASPHQAEGRP